MDRTLTYLDTDMHYTVTGDGAMMLILMHGWGCSATTVESIRTTAVACGYRVLTVDFPGHGLSAEPRPRPGGEPWGIEEFTQLIEQLAETEGASRPALIGHSFGGRVAIMYASRNDCDRIVLVDSAGIKPRRPLSYYCKVYSFKFTKWLTLTFMGSKRGNARIEAMRARRGSADYRAASPAMRSVMAKVVNEDLKHVMPLIKAPTLLMWGENDTATPLSDARTMERLIPDAGLVSFAGCGHYSFLDNPATFRTVLTNFLTSTR